MSSRAVPTSQVQTGYDPVAKTLHWLMALLVIVTIPIGLTMLRIGPGNLQNQLFTIHKGIGVTLLALIVLRILWRVTHTAPPLRGLPGWQVGVAHANHLLLYVMLAVMAASGYIFTVYGGYPIEFLDALGVPYHVAKNEPVSKVAEAVHVWGWILILALILLHIGAALYHGVVRRDGVVSRMSGAARR